MKNRINKKKNIFDSAIFVIRVRNIQNDAMCTLKTKLLTNVVHILHHISTHTLSYSLSSLIYYIIHFRICDILVFTNTFPPC